MAAAAGWLERPVLNSFSFDACIETFALRASDERGKVRLGDE